MGRKESNQTKPISLSVSDNVVLSMSATYQTVNSLSAFNNVVLSLSATCKTVNSLSVADNVVLS